MKLYHSPGACSDAPRIIANAVGVPLELIAVDLSTGLLADGTPFDTINRKGYVPALELDDGTLLTEGVAIDLYLVSLNPESTIAPQAGSLAYFQMVSWLTLMATELHKNFGPAFIKHFGASVPEETLAQSLAVLAKNFALIEETLTTQSFLLGDTMSCADVYLYVVLGWTFALSIELNQYPHIQRFYQLMGAQPAVKSIHA